MRGARGVTFQHLKTTRVGKTKFTIVGEASPNTDDIVIDDCWVRGETGDPNSDYSNSSNYPNLSRDLINTTGSTTGAIGNFTVTNCRIEWGDSLLNIRVDRPGSESVTTGNEFAYFYGDAIGVTVAPTAPLPTTICDNLIYGPVGLATDSAAPYVDAIRLLGNLSAAADWDNILIERNIILQGDARGDMQGIFLDDIRTSAGDSGHFFTATVRDNIVAIDFSVHGISILQAKGCLVDNNTVISWNRTSSNAPSILIGSSGLVTGTSGGGNAIKDCIADNIGDSLGSLTLSNNFAAGLNGTIIDCSTLFGGPTFDPRTVEEATTLLSPKISAGAVIP